MNSFSPDNTSHLDTQLVCIHRDFVDRPYPVQVYVYYMLIDFFNTHTIACDAI